MSLPIMPLELQQGESGEPQSQLPMRTNLVVASHEEKPFFCFLSSHFLHDRTPTFTTDFFLYVHFSFVPHRNIYLFGAGGVAEVFRVAIVKNIYIFVPICFPILKIIHGYDFQSDPISNSKAE